MANTIQVEMTLVALDCATCGATFAMSELLNQKKRRDHAAFYCPSGHSNYYPQQTAEEKVRDELAQVRAKLAAAKREAEWAKQDYQAEKRSHTATKGTLTKTLKRVAAGVCPHCHRHFVNLERHCKTKHPGAPPED